MDSEKGQDMPILQERLGC